MKQRVSAYLCFAYAIINLIIFNYLYALFQQSVKFNMDHSLLVFLQIVTGLFVSILFLQSGLDKVFNFKGNKGYIDSVFEKTFLKSFSGVLFVSITLLETAAGILCVVGSVLYFFTHESCVLLLGLQLSAISLVGLFFGQRIAKDYAGAASLVPYFILVLFGIALFVFAG